MTNKKDATVKTPGIITVNSIIFSHTDDETWFNILYFQCIKESNLLHFAVDRTHIFWLYLRVHLTYDSIDFPFDSFIRESAIPFRNTMIFRAPGLLI